MNNVVTLPEPRAESKISLEQTLQERHSRRYYMQTPVTIHDVSQVLWAAYGFQQQAGKPGGARGITAPSAGGIYPLHLYLVAGAVEGIPAGFYEYKPADHSMKKIHDNDLRPELCAASYNQKMLADAPATIVYAADPGKVSGRYGERGITRYIPMDIGHSAQNVYLQAGALGLGTCAVGAFDDSEVRKVLQLPDRLIPMYLMPFGHCGDR